MGDATATAGQRLVDRTIRGAIPHRRRQQPEPAHPVDAVVMDPVLLQRVAVSAKHGAFSSDNLVFTTRLLILVVN
jgi:hypothetical protein